MMLSRRQFLTSSTVLINAHAAPDPKYKLIAHRGGIVDSQYAENSPGSIQAAIDRGYWMIEVDIRRTKDGEPIIHHDQDFNRFYGNPGKVTELTWKEIGGLRSTPGGTSPLHFQEVCRMCEGKIKLMLDIKGNDYPEGFYISVRNLLEKHDLLRSAYSLSGGGELAQKHIFPHCYLSADRNRLKAAIAAGEDVGSRRFLFELASVLDEDALELASKHHVVAAAGINTFRYTMAKRDEEQGPTEDAARLKKLGVTHYQIDSRYDYLFTK